MHTQNPRRCLVFEACTICHHIKQPRAIKCRVNVYNFVLKFRAVSDKSAKMPGVTFLPHSLERHDSKVGIIGCCDAQLSITLNIKNCLMLLSYYIALT